MINRITLVFLAYMAATQFVCLGVAAEPIPTIPAEKPKQTQSVPGTAIYGCNFGLDEANRLAKNGVFIGKDSRADYLDLAFGNILLNPDKDIVVATHAGDIHVPADATVFISESGNGLIVYDLGQPETKAVSVIVGKYKFNMEPGRMFALSAENVDNFAQTDISCRSIPYANSEKLDLPRLTIQAFVADFSIPSAVITIEPLKRLTISSNSEDKLLLQKIARSTEIIEKDIAAGRRKPIPK